MSLTPKELSDLLDFNSVGEKTPVPGKDGEDAPKILDISQNKKHELIITFDNGEQINAGGLPKGEKGEFIKGEPGKDGESLKGDKGDPGESIKGEPGLNGISIKGDDGLGFEDATISEGKLILIRSDGKEINAGIVKGKDGRTIIREVHSHGGGGGGSAHNVKTQLEKTLISIQDYTNNFLLMGG